MKKSLLVLLLAVLAPSVLLGWLALRSAREQQIVLERRTAELYQQETDNLAAAARSLVSEQRRMFAETLRELLGREDARALAGHFTGKLRAAWPQPAIGFALDDAGRFLSPTAREADGDAATRQFLQENSAFLNSRTAATAYPVAMEELNRPEISLRNRAQNNAAPSFADQSTQSALAKEPKRKAAAPATAPAATQEDRNMKSVKPDFSQSNETQQTRKVMPQQQTDPVESQVYGANAEFRQFTAEGGEGVVNRFVQDRLNMIFWVRPAGTIRLVFGCVLHGEDLLAQWPSLFTAMSGPKSGRDYADEWLSRTSREPDYVLALLDDRGQPVATSQPGAPAQDWKKPFVASEIGDALPHWEAALYLRHPEQLRESARQVRRNLFLLILCALAAIAAGGWTVFRDARRQLALAQKKTDFVSNVSHELKTPLTSIRLFAELLDSGRAAPERQTQYLRIITVESERLTRLINNVLDFSRLDRRERRFQKKPLDLHALLTQLWPAQEFHLREAGFTTHWESAPPPYPIEGDEDALAQVLVNLLSNAEKYGGEKKEVTLHSFPDGPWACLSVLDRGPGVPPGEERKIFEPFYRANDSLSSGVPGTGLGLALALRTVREHGGEIFYQPRPGGGSNFTVRLPLARVTS